MAYKIKYDGEADVLMVILEELGDIIVHFERDGSRFLWRYLKKLVPLMVEG
jgi:hypothetical protein